MSVGIRSREESSKDKKSPAPNPPSLALCLGWEMGKTGFATANPGGREGGKPFQLCPREGEACNPLLLYAPRGVGVGSSPDLGVAASKQHRTFGFVVSSAAPTSHRHPHSSSCPMSISLPPSQSPPGGRKVEERKVFLSHSTLHPRQTFYSPQRARANPVTRVRSRQCDTFSPALNFSPLPPGSLLYTVGIRFALDQKTFFLTGAHQTLG